MKTLMKVLGILLLIPLVLFFMLLVQSLALVDAVRGTLGSAVVVQRAFDANVTQKDLEDLAASAQDALNGGGEGTGDGPGGLPLPTAPVGEPTGGATIQIRIDPVWFAGTARTLFLGTHAYFVGAEDTLPTIDVRPVLTQLQAAVIQGIVQEAQADAEPILMKAVKAIRKMPGGGLDANGDPTQKALDYMKSSADLQSLGLTDETVAAATKEILRLPADGETASLTERFVTVIVEDKLDLGSVSGQFAIGTFLVNLYGTEDNVVMVARNRAIDIANTAGLSLWIGLVLLVLLIGLVSFSPRGAPLWYGIPLLLTGLGTLLTGLLNALVRTALGGAIASALRSGGGGDGSGSLLPTATPGAGAPNANAAVDALQRFAFSLLDRTTARLATDGIVLVVVGIVLIVLGIVAGVLLKKRREKAEAAALEEQARTGLPPAPKRSWYWYLLAGRAVLAVLLVVLLAGAVGKAVDRIGLDVKAIESAKSEATVDPMKAIDATLGTGFAQLVPEASPSPSPGAGS